MQAAVLFQSLCLWATGSLVLTCLHYSPFSVFLGPFLHWISYALSGHIHTGFQLELMTSFRYNLKFLGQMPPHRIRCPPVGPSLVAGGYGYGRHCSWSPAPVDLPEKSARDGQRPQTVSAGGSYDRYICFHPASLPAF